MYKLVGRWTDKGIAKAKQKAEERVYGTRDKLNFEEEFWKGSVWAVTSEQFPAPQLIRAYFKAHRENFIGGMSPEWDKWLYGPDSTVNTINQDGECEYFWMEAEEYNRVHGEWRERWL
jgi:hypothetical protein